MTATHQPDDVRAAQRRDFLRHGWRVLVLGGLGALAATLAGRRGVHRAGHSESCVAAGLCSGCPRIVTCGLPAALSRRVRQKGSPHGTGDGV